MAKPKILLAILDSTLHQQINSLLLDQQFEFIEVPGYPRVIDYLKTRIFLEMHENRRL